MSAEEVMGFSLGILLEEEWEGDGLIMGVLGNGSRGG